jgi:6,7-dimethyl-8-ribityllumazine synthase
MHTAVPLLTDARGLRVGIATSRYHHEITGRLHQGARNAFLEAGGREDDLIVVDAPGSFELVAIAHALASRADVDAVVCLGCVITGETTHDRYICEAVANGFADITARTGKPVAFGVLTCQTVEQAVVRSGGGDGARSSVSKGSNVSKGNKGEEAMHAALIAARAVERIQRLPLGRPA